MRLEGKTAVVTGAGSGIGQAIAETFAREGAHVVAIGRTLSKLEAVRDGAGEAATRLHPIACDVADRQQVRSTFEQARLRLGQIDILVNNAGSNIARRALKDLSVEDFELLVQINLNGAYYCIHEVLPEMRERRDGLIINVSSIAGVRASDLGGAAYSASKFGMTGLSQTIHLEEGPNGIRSCLICPGEVNTPIIDKRALVPSAEQRAQMLQPEDLAQAALMIACLHPRATIPELIITPTVQRFA
jgi:NAD(P)-dependent dehydrogenase (short-subunit alcohol dehydrogenase family)